MSDLLALGISHKTAPLELRERLALTEGRAAGVLNDLRSHEQVSEAAAISTCNRTELYLVVTEPVEAENVALGALSRQAGIRPTELIESLYSYRGIEAGRHLFRVAAGLDSMIVGEAEIQGQVKRAYELALVEGATGAILNRLFRGALAAGKRVRDETRIGEGGDQRPLRGRRARDPHPRRPHRSPRPADRRRRDRRADRPGADRPRRRGRLRRQPPLRPRDRPRRALRRQRRPLRGPSRPARGSRHRRLLDQLPPSHRRARGARARRRRARLPAAAAHRPRGAARHRPVLPRRDRRRRPRRRRRPDDRRPQRQRARGRGARGRASSSPPSWPASSAGSARSRCCRPSPRCGVRADEIVGRVLAENDRSLRGPQRRGPGADRGDGALDRQPHPPRADAAPEARRRGVRRLPAGRRAARAVRARCRHRARGQRRRGDAAAHAAPSEPETDRPERAADRHPRQRPGAGAGRDGRRRDRRRRAGRDPDLRRRGRDRPPPRPATSRGSSARSSGRCSTARSSSPSTAPRTSPASCPTGSSLVGVPAREDPADAWIGPRRVDRRGARRRPGRHRERAPPLAAPRAAPRPRGGRAARQRRHAAAASSRTARSTGSSSPPPACAGSAARPRSPSASACAR